MKVYDVTAKKLSRATDSELKRLQETFDNFQKSVAAAKVELEQRTQDYIDSSIAYSTTQLQAAFALIHDRDVKQYFKELAKELDRPFIFAEDTKDHGYYNGQYKYLHYTTLVIPATNRLKNVVAGLNLVAQHNGKIDEHDVIAVHSERVWRFTFKDAGLEVLTDFIETCRTNPVMRITLGVRRVTLGGNDAGTP